MLLNSENRTEIDGRYNNMSHKKNPMNSLSPKDDGRRTSPRKSAGRMPHYLARESNEEKVGKGVKKSGGGVSKRAVAEESELSSSSDSVRSIQPRKKSRGITVEEKGVKGSKKLGVGLNKRMAAMKQSESSSYDDDSDSVTSVQPRKKSRGTTVGRMSGGTRSLRVSRGAKVAKGKKSSAGASAAKGKKTPEYESDDFSPSGDDSDSTHNSRTGKHSVKDLLEKIKEKDEMIRSLNLKLSNSKVTSRMNKTKVREELKWTGEETNFSETVNHFCRFYLFPRFKFLKNGWTEFMPDKENSFYSLCMRHLKIPEGADKKDIWERVIVPSVMRKYLNMKCNLNNDIKSVYMSMTTCLCESTFAGIVNYTDIYFRENSENLHTIEKWLFICHTVNSCLVLVTPESLNWKYHTFVFLPLKYTRFLFCLSLYHTAVDLSMDLSHIGCSYICVSHERENTMKIYTPSDFGHRNITPSYCHASCS